MRIPLTLAGIFLFGLTSFSQSIPPAETIFSIHKKEKQTFDFSLQKGYTLKALVKQMGIDLSISIYKKGDTSRLAYFDSPNGEYGPEPVQFEATDNGNYILVLEPLDENTVLEGKYSIRQLFIRVIQATHDTSFADGSNIVLKQLDPLKVENLTNLGMVWGFLKYYHPAVARGDYNWDAELFRIMPQIISAKSKTEANTALEKWVDEIGKPESCLTCNDAKSDSTVQINPDYGNLFVKGNLSSSLIQKLNFIKENRNQDENFYVGKFAGVGNPVFEHENPYKKMIYPDVGYRLLSLYRYWNIIQYFFPYKYVIGEDWKKVLPEFIPKFVNAGNATSYALVCLEIIARIHDTHANVWSNNKELRDYFGKYVVPVQANFIENKMVVTGYYIDSPAVRDKLRIGDIINGIEGKPVDQLVKNNLYLTPASNYETQLRDMPYRLLRSGSDSLSLEILRDGKMISSKVSCVEAEKVNVFLRFNPNPKDSSYKIINGISVIYFGRYHDRQLPDIKDSFKNTKGLIIDMRTYPSEFMPFTFGNYIKPTSSPFVKFTVGDVNYPGIFRYTPLLSNGDPNTAYYKGPIVELVNSITQSQAEYTTMAFQTAPDLTVIGSTTAGADGNISPIYLPGGVVTMISGIGVFIPTEGKHSERESKSI
jgi:hypothetical protein